MKYSTQLSIGGFLFFMIWYGLELDPLYLLFTHTAAIGAMICKLIENKIKEQESKLSEPNLNLQGIKEVNVTQNPKGDSSVELVGDFHAVERVKSFALGLLKQEQDHEKTKS